MINVEDSLRQLRAWSEDCRTKWGAIQRVINARREHHQQFYAGGDASHCLFVETLQTDSDRLERFMKLLDRRAYAVSGAWHNCLINHLTDAPRAQIALAQTEAEWILTAPTSTFICDEPTAPLTPPTTPPSPSHSLPSSSLTKNQRKKAHRKQRKNSTSSTSSTSPSSDLDLALAPSCCAPSFDTSDLHARPQAQLAALRAYLLPPQDLPSTIRPTSWYALVATLIRYVVLRTPSLAPLAFAMSSSSSSASVEGFLDLLEERIDSRCGEEIEQLWKGMKFPTLEQAASSASTSVSKQKQKKQKDEIKPLLGVGILGDALADIFREGEERETGVYVELLGGKLYKEASERELNLEGWALFYQFVSRSLAPHVDHCADWHAGLQVACAGCGLALTRTFASFLRNRRLALLGAFPAWLNPAESPAEHVLRLANISLNASNIHTAGVKVKRVEQKDDTGKRGKAGKKQVSIEEWERPWVYIRMVSCRVFVSRRFRSRYCTKLRENSWAQATLSALASQPERFVLLARDGSTGKMTHEPKIESSCHTRGCTCGARSDLWLGRVRSGLSPAERKSARWTMSSCEFECFPLSLAGANPFVMSLKTLSLALRFPHRLSPRLAFVQLVARETPRVRLCRRSLRGAPYGQQASWNPVWRVARFLERRSERRDAVQAWVRRKWRRMRVV